MRSIENIIELIKSIKGVTSETEVAKLLEMKQPALNVHKIRNSIPYKQIINFCNKEKISLDRIFSGTDMTSNPVVEKINTWLRAHPDDAEMILKIIEGREAMERLKNS